MSGRLIMTVSAVVLFVAGTAALFAPQEIAGGMEAAPSRTLALAIQLVGSGLLGFAVLNWMSRRNRIGGVYARPTGIANLLLFTTAGLTLVREALAGALPPAGWGAGAVFVALALSFGWLVFASDPLAEPRDS